MRLSLGEGRAASDPSSRPRHPPRPIIVEILRRKLSVLERDVVAPPCRSTTMKACRSFGRCSGREASWSPTRGVRRRSRHAPSIGRAVQSGNVTEHLVRDRAHAVRLRSSKEPWHRPALGRRRALPIAVYLSFKSASRRYENGGNNDSVGAEKRPRKRRIARQDHQALPDTKVRRATRDKAGC